MRARGEGSVVERTMRRRDGTTYKRYLAVITLGRGADGKRKRVYGPLRTSKQAAAADLSSLRAMTVTGTEPDKEELGDYLRAWLEGKKPDLKIRAYDTYKADLENHIIPALGGIRLCDLKPAHVERLVSTLRKSSLAAARKSRAVLHAALEDAMRVERIPRNPAALVPAPKAPPRPKIAWKVSDAREFARHAMHVPLAGPVFLTCLATGLRIGEALGLQWRDLEGDVLSVRRQLLTVGPARFDTPKTRKGRRKLRLGVDAVAMLEAHRRDLQRLGLHQHITVPWVGGEAESALLMFPDHRGLPWRLETLRDRFNGLIAAAEVPRIRIHDLRHYHLSRLIDLGEDPATVSRKAGHSRTSTTLDIYVEPFEDRLLGAGVELADLLKSDG